MSTDHGPYITAVSAALGAAGIHVTDGHADDHDPRGGYIETTTPGRPRPIGLGWDEERGWYCGQVDDHGRLNLIVDFNLGLVPAPAAVVQAVRIRLGSPADPLRYRSHEDPDPQLEAALAAYLPSEDNDRG